MFAVLMLALLPLGVVSVFSAFETVRTAETERVTSLRLSAAEAASKINAALNGDRQTLRLLANALEEDPQRSALCRRAAMQMKVGEQFIAFAIYDREGKRLCGVGDVPFSDVGGGPTGLDRIAEIMPQHRRLLIRINSLNADLNAVARYSPEMLLAMSGLRLDQNGYFTMSLSSRSGRLTLAQQGRPRSNDAIDSTTTPLNVAGIMVHVATGRPPVDLLMLAATVLPLIVWAAAAGAGWWVVNHFLIKPLIDLNRQVAAYQPGHMLDLAPANAGFAREIQMLGDTFREIAEDVVNHEAQLAEALVQQRALTREVHHRVKNNLQIIASLINLHSRATDTPEAAMAYASIQRRVDALSVVHRNHYAAAEMHAGISAQALIGELASALRASGPANGTSGFAIKVDGETLYLSQDVAVPVAFLITELVELVILTGNPVPVWISVRPIAEDRAELTVVSEALRPSDMVDALVAQRFGRVLTGLSRQLRAALDYDAAQGRYAIAIPTRG